MINLVLKTLVMTPYMCPDTLRFISFSVHRIQTLTQFDRFSDYDKESFELLWEAAKAWADKDFFPYYRDMDEHPAVYQEGRVRTHPILKKIFHDAGENGWLGQYFDYEDGGMQLPHSVVNGINHILESANNHIPGYLGLTTGSAHLIASFGNESLKKTYIPPMLAGKWSGTMALTEPQAGSSLSDITTTAYPLGDGTYAIKGQKIFISGGDHEATENFVHLTLARIDGAPPGTRGISLFVVPKFRPENGELVYNDVSAVADFQKLGQRGYSTVHLVYGEKDQCRGELVGEPHKGLSYMFQMMNGARIDVGMTAVSTATAAYYASLKYAGERPQGRKILNSGKKDLTTEQTLIIHHPDVRRMLLAQKAINEGALSLIMECSYHSDMAACETGEKQEKHRMLLELLTPVAKTYPAEKGREAVNNGLQILGGYGFCMDFPLQQYLRDIRIMSIYEGTTGIQSLDLLGRKIPMNDGRAWEFLTEEIRTSINIARTYSELASYATLLDAALSDAKEVLAYLMPYATEGDFENYLADATIFMEMISHLVIAHQWLKMATTAHRYILEEKNEFRQEFYISKITAMKYFYKYELPKVKSCLLTIKSDDKVTLPDRGVDIF
jgi:butyryl-CoA dehydrogenase